MKFSPSLPPNLFESPLPVPPGVYFRLVRWRDLYALHHACFFTEPFDEYATRFESSINLQQAGRLLHVVASLHASARIVGSGQLVSYTDTTVEIADLRVTEGMRNQGIGTALVRVLGTLGIAAGARELEIAVDVHNRRALALYRRLGFRARRLLLVPRRGRAVLLVRSPWPLVHPEENDDADTK